MSCWGGSSRTSASASDGFYREKTVRGGEREWAPYQWPGAFAAMHSVCTQLRGVHLVRGAGHSVAEEQPEAVNRLLIGFLRQAIPADR